MDTGTRQEKEKARLHEQLLLSCPLVAIDTTVLDAMIGTGAGAMDDAAVMDMFLVAGCVTETVQ